MTDATHGPARPLLGLLLRLLHQHHAQEVDGALRDAGFGDIRPHYANVFPFVPDDGIQVVELARHAGVRKQSMGQTVEEMERAGYVERRPDPSDGRAKLVFLTAKGRSVRPVALAAGRRVEELWADVIGDDLEQLRDTLETLLEHLRARDAGPR
ncbi:MAG: MarR family winged helix-turn-helix transcriptional regulator [Nocardioidaceae bacterium]